MSLPQQFHKGVGIVRSATHLCTFPTKGEGATDVVAIARSVRYGGASAHNIGGLANLELGTLDVVAEVTLKKGDVAECIMALGAFRPA